MKQVEIVFALALIGFCCVNLVGLSADGGCPSCLEDEDTAVHLLYTSSRGVNNFSTATWNFTIKHNGQARESLKCYTCDGKKDCNSPKRYDCNPMLANATRNYLDFHYVNIPTNTTSIYYECMRDSLKSTSGEFYHRGCIYSNIKSCNYAARPQHQQGKFERSCYQCSNKDGCNPADRAGATVLTVCAAIAAAAVLGKFVWRN